MSAAHCQSEKKPVHLSVLLAEVLAFLQPEKGGLYVDGNVGMGGHSRAILEETGPDGRVLGFDWDEHALGLARENLRQYEGRIELIRRNFAEIREVLDEMNIASVDGLILDLGLSSFQLDASGRGFSFQGSQPLDMRMDSRRKETAADILNRSTEQELADMFYFFGEERQARPIASRVVALRKKQPFCTTDQLVALIEEAVPRRFWPKKIHVATKVFQALRIAVNEELENLEKMLGSLADCVRPGGRICVISFHSLEDRLVKRAFRDNMKLDVITPRPITAGEKELHANPRARSARMRVASVRESR